MTAVMFLMGIHNFHFSDVSGSRARQFEMDIFVLEWMIRLK